MRTTRRLAAIGYLVRMTRRRLILAGQVTPRNRLKAAFGGTSHAVAQAMNSVTSTRRLPVSQLYTQLWGFFSFSPMARWVKPAASRIARRKGGKAW
jgi:Na+/phosphate symporter